MGHDLAATSPSRSLPEIVVAELDEARRRSTALLAPLSDDQLGRQHSRLMSPLVWDLAHVANYEDLWLVRALGHAAVRAEIDDLYDAFRHARHDRPALPLLGPAEARAYAHAVRQRALDLFGAGGVGGADALLENAFVYGMVIQHEHQHDETMLATLQLMRDPYGPIAEPHLIGGPSPMDGRASAPVTVPAGEFVMGTDTDPWAYDNERPAHPVHVAEFRISPIPATNQEYAEFVDAGGYGDPQYWTAEGWAHRRKARLEHPQFWRREGQGSWSVLRFGVVTALEPDEAVQHICWHEAAAFAAWRGGRLPTEAEWEKAARSGLLHHVGEVWEWTASDFTAYPGFRSFPYREYSEVFYGHDHKVLRGSSWATHRSVARPTFRNWDFPIRRQIFSGVRCAWDA